MFPQTYIKSVGILNILILLIYIEFEHSNTSHRNLGLLKKKKWDRETRRKRRKGNGKERIRRKYVWKNKKSLILTIKNYNVKSVLK